MVVLMDDVEVVEYDSNWPLLFGQEKDLLLETLSTENVLAIEHFGSTAIPGLEHFPITRGHSRQQRNSFRIPLV